MAQDIIVYIIIGIAIAAIVWLLWRNIKGDNRCLNCNSTKCPIAKSRKRTT